MILDSVPVEVVVEVLVVVGSGPGDAPNVPHEGLVGGPQPFMSQLPAPVAEVIEACPVATKVGTLLHTADTTQGVLKIGIDLKDNNNEEISRQYLFIPGLSC